MLSASSANFVPYAESLSELVDIVSSRLRTSYSVLYAVLIPLFRSEFPMNVMRAVITVKTKLINTRPLTHIADVREKVFTRDLFGAD